MIFLRLRNKIAHWIYYLCIIKTNGDSFLFTFSVLN